MTPSLVELAMRYDSIVAASWAGTSARTPDASK
jgi:hypothetical protein